MTQRMEPASGSIGRVLAISIAMVLVLPCVLALTAGSAGAVITDAALLDSLERTAFDYFWLEANPANGLIKDRNTPGSPASIASMGFGFTAICIGIDHGWVTREAGRARILTALNTLWTKPQGSGASGIIGYQGLFYHFLDMNTAFRTWDCELSTIDTALLFAGILDARGYFDTSDSLDGAVRALADSITRRADWNWARNSGLPAAGIRMGWRPGTGFGGFGQWIGYNEAMILYIIALGSPTFPVPPETWGTWTSGYDWQTWYGQTYVNFPPLFGHQYSHCWIDFQGRQDPYMISKGIDYFENSRRATLAQRQYCIVNPGVFIGYSDSLWGITAGDGPDGYEARGAPPAQNDDGTITPTAAASSIPFAPEVVLPALRNMYNTYGTMLWMKYGFRDGFNLDRGWWGPDVIGIDQGPIIIMIENYLNGSVWSRFMQSEDIIRGLARAGFSGFTGVGSDPANNAGGVWLSQNAPNPFRDVATIGYRLPAPEHVRLTVYDVAGREVSRLVDGTRPAGAHEAVLRAEGLASGVYTYRLEAGGRVSQRRLVLLK
jgi:hypothetical protein